MAHYYASFFYAVPAIPVVWYVPTQSKPNSSTPSPSVQGHRRRHSSNSTPDGAHTPWKRLQRSPSSSSSSHPPWQYWVPPIPQLRTVPLPWMSNAWATVDERGHHPFMSAHGGSAANQAPPLSTTPPSVDPFIAVPPHPNARRLIVWDMARHPSNAVLNHPSLTHDALRRRCAVRTSRVDGPRQPLRSLVLVIPLLQIETEIVTVPSVESAHAGLGLRLGGYVSIWDVLEGLYYELRAPIGPQELRKLSPSERETLLTAAEDRVPAGERGHTLTLRKIDYLSRRRWFLGVRPALGYELPKGRTLGEVFVVEVGTPGAAGWG